MRISDTVKAGILPVDEGLRATSRLPPLCAGHETVRRLELAALALAGIAAALLTHLLRLHLGIPGSSIVFTIVPLAFGFALVPRRGAGAVMSGAALATTAVLGVAGVRLDGIGAVTSLIVTGPLLDLARRWGQAGGWRLYRGFVLAGAASNAAAFVVRAAAKLLELPGGTVGGSFHAWWPRAVVSYSAAGLLAGLAAATAWFRLRDGARR